MAGEFSPILIALRLYSSNPNTFPTQISCKTKIKNPHSSYLWSSLPWGRDLLQQRVGWKISGGSQVNIWQDNCVPSISHFKPYVNRSNLFLDLKVKHLIHHDSDSWDESILCTYFHPLDIHKIQKI